MTVEEAAQYALEVLQLCDMRPSAGISGSEDGGIRTLCEQVGYGAVMHSASRQWMEKDPVGAITTGPCQATVERAIARLEDGLGKLGTGEPIPLVLNCPVCATRHVDRPDPATGWTNPPHRSHLCQHCECIWRPADVCTTGVVSIETRGGSDNWRNRLAEKPEVNDDG